MVNLHILINLQSAFNLPDSDFFRYL